MTKPHIRIHVEEESHKRCGKCLFNSKTPIEPCMDVALIGRELRCWVGKGVYYTVVPSPHPKAPDGNM